MEDRLTIEYVPLAALKAWPRNPKEHDLPTISRSIERFGFINPIIINEETGTMLAGHGRVDALLMAQKRGDKCPDRCVSENGDWLVPVVRGVRVEEDEQGACIVGDNQSTILGGWDDSKLADILGDLVAGGIDLNGTGFTPQDLDVLESHLKIRDFTRPDFDGVVEKLVDSGKGKAAGNEQWFYIEFYGDNDAYEAICAKLGEALKGKHEIRPDVFYRLVMGKKAYDAWAADGGD